MLEIYRISLGKNSIINTELSKFGENIWETRKSSCVTVRGIPPMCNSRIIPKKTSQKNTQFFFLKNQKKSFQKWKKKIWKKFPGGWIGGDGWGDGGYPGRNLVAKFWTTGSPVDRQTENITFASLAVKIKGEAVLGRRWWQHEELKWEICRNKLNGDGFLCVKNVPRRWPGHIIIWHRLTTRS